MIGQKLSDKMKKVLCGISLYPEDSNKMLAKRISVNASTVSTSLRRIKERGLIRKNYIPAFFNIDMGSIVVASGKFRYQFPDDIRETIIGFVTHPATPFFSASDNTSWLAMSLLTPAKSESVKEISSKLSDRYVNEMTFNVTKVQFDNENTKVWRYFDYSQLLSNKLNTKMGQRKYLPSLPWTLDELRKNEKIILQSLIHDSEPTDYQRSQILDISHPTITKIRKSLIDRGIIITMAEPNLSAFGFSTFAWFGIKLGGKEIENNLLTSLCTYPNNILFVQGRDNIFVLSVFEDMKDLMLGQQKANEFMSKAMIPYEDISFNYFSLENPSLALKTNMIPAAQAFIGVSKSEENDTLSKDQEHQLVNILENFFSAEEVSSIIGEVKNSLSIGLSKGESETVMSMTLELLTEPKYLSPLERKERTALQAKLIEKLNCLRAKIETSDQFADEGKRRRVMIVEDSKAMIDLLKDMFKEANFNVLGAVDNGLSAFELYKKLRESNNRPDVVLMDIFIKGLNGVETTKMIKDFDPSACVVVLTSSLNSKIKSEMNSMGVDGYLIKPVTKAQLINSLEQSIAKKRGMIG